MKIDGGNIENSSISGLIALAVAAVVFLVGALSFSSWIRSPISYIYNPIAFSGAQVGRELRSYIFLFKDISQFRDDYNGLKERVLELEVANNYVSTLEEENQALEKQLSLGNTKSRYVLADVVYQLGQEGGADLLISKGSNNSVKEGDLVVLGNAFVGTIDRVDSGGASIKLPLNKSTRLQVLIVKQVDINELSVESIGKNHVSSENIKAVSIGTGSEVRLENIPVDSGVKSGDSVVVADERVGEYLVLGQIDEVNKDLAAATSSATVSLAVDYEILYKVFVRTEE